MNDIYILGIESSCDETSCAIVKNGNEIISNIINTQIPIHEKFGGVVPEIASRKHVECISAVIEKCLSESKMNISEIDAIAVTYGPGLIGSLLVGIESAKMLSLLYNKPLIPVHHIAGHIYANNLVKPIKYPALCLVISGGHTELVLIEDEYKFKIIGTTLDDAVGECYDKVARVLDLSYPGGPKIDKLAKEGNNTYNLPTPLDDDSYNFSFSGLKSAVINLVHNEKQKSNIIRKEDLACSFQNVVSNILTKKALKALKEYDVKYFITAGGVAANSEIRRKLEKMCNENNIEYSFPDKNCCTDNGAMIASAGFFAFKKGIISTLELNGVSSVSIEESCNI